MDDKENEISTFEVETYWMYFVCVWLLWLIHVFNDSFLFHLDLNVRNLSWLVTQK